MDGRKLYPLAHPQKRIWLTEKLHPGTGMWNNSGTAKVKGPLDTGLLEQAVNQVIKYNEALRICITQVNGEPFQYVRDFQYRELEVLDFSQKGLSELYEWDGIQSQTAMPLLDQDLCYFAVLKISDREWGLYGKLHHMISDAWSAVMVCDQMMENYDRLLSGLDMQEQTYGSYIESIAKEKEYLDSKRFLKDREALGEMFSNLPEPTVLKQKKSNYTSLRARRKSCIINKGLADRMREYCKQNDTSIFSLYLSGLCVYINRILNKDDIIIGTPVFNRTTREEKNTVGMFVSTVPVRIKVDDGMGFNAFVKAVSGEWYRILKHQKYPYEMLLSNLRKTNKDLDSLYDIVLSYQNAQFKKNTSNFTYEARWHFTGSQVGSLTIHINDREGEGRLIVDYDHQVPLFSLKEIEYIHSHCETILTDAISHPNKELYELDIMEPEELNRILYDFNANKAEYNLDRGLDALFLQQMKKTPDAVALVAGAESLTYARLNALVNKMAFHLMNRGVGRNSVVGVVIRRDYTLLVSILAVIRAGGAFLPIDPDFPTDRIQLILKESGAQFVIASPDVVAKCTGICEVTRADCLDSIPEYSQEIPGNNHMQDLAYVIYTSGSTGKPKGVMVEQRSIVHFLYTLSDVLDFSPGNIVLSLATISFDVFIKETLPTLMNGGTVVLADEAEAYSPTNLAALMERTGVNKFMFTPTRMQLLMLEKRADVCLKNMKEIILGGEVLQKKLLDDIKKRTEAKILYFYGPTEATIAATYKDLTDSNSINIGKPLANMNVYILDKHKNPVPIGTEGELYIGGVGVARGYLNNAAQTEKSFFESPFKRAEPLYKTGDIARWFPLGEIEFIGRTDEQVKIRGLRIELEEIGNVISECNGIEKAFVVDYRKDESHHLCSYYTKNGDVNESELRNSLRKKLPVYMIPSYFIELDQFPMTPSGKLDKNALPDPQFIAFHQKETKIKGLSITEKKMAAVWKKVLKIKKVSKEDNFFELGGDSLAVIRVQNEMLKFGIEFKIQDFYEMETLCAICGSIDSGKGLNKDSFLENELFEREKTNFVPFIDYSPAKLETVLLTGANGYLGAHVLAELITHYHSQVYCVLHSKTDADAERKLVESLVFYFGEKKAKKFIQSVHILSGDISVYKFSLTDDKYSQLAQQISSVIHCAAITSHYGKQEDFEKANIIGTKNIVDFCISYKKTMLYMSTMSVSGSTIPDVPNKTYIFSESCYDIGQNYSWNEYVKSKFIAEGIVLKAAADGLDCRIYRVGNLTARLSDGKFQMAPHKNAFFNTLNCILSAGIAPEEFKDVFLEFTPVDSCATAILALSQICGKNPAVFHLYNHKKIAFSEFIKQSGCFFQFAFIPQERFIKIMRERNREAKGGSSIIDMLDKLNIQKVSGQNIKITSSHTLTALHKAGFDWPDLEGQYLSGYIRTICGLGG